MLQQVEAAPRQRRNIRQTYEAPLGRYGAGGYLWPADMPALTAIEAERAARRLYRWAMGETFAGPVLIASGNRRNRIDYHGGRLALIVNPSHGWRDFVHDFGHAFWYRANYGQPDASGHSKAHARFEVRMAKEVIRRGYLAGKLRDAEPAAVPAIAPADALTARRQAKLDSIDGRIAKWEAKQRRAETALRKLAKSRRYYAAALAAEK